MASTKKVVFEVADDYMDFELGDLTGLELLYEDTKKDYKEGLN